MTLRTDMFKNDTKYFVLRKKENKTVYNTYKYYCSRLPNLLSIVCRNNNICSLTPRIQLLLEAIFP